MPAVGVQRTSSVGAGKVVRVRRQILLVNPVNFADGLGMGRTATALESAKFFFAFHLLDDFRVSFREETGHGFTPVLAIFSVHYYTPI